MLIRQKIPDYLGIPVSTEIESAIISLGPGYLPELLNKSPCIATHTLLGCLVKRWPYLS